LINCRKGIGTAVAEGEGSATVGARNTRRDRRAEDKKKEWGEAARDRFATELQQLADRIIPQSEARGAARNVHSAGLISFGGILNDRRHALAQGRQISFSWLFNGARHYPDVIMGSERRSALLSFA